jgi:hypothetical protein
VELGGLGVLDLATLGYALRLRWASSVFSSSLIADDKPSLWLTKVGPKSKTLGPIKLTSIRLVWMMIVGFANVAPPWFSYIYKDCYCFTELTRDNVTIQRRCSTIFSSQ